MNAANVPDSGGETPVALSSVFVPDWAAEFDTTDGFHPAKRMRELLAGKASDDTMERLAWRPGATVIAS